MKKLKVLHYISGISPTIGGIEKFILNFYEAQKNNVEIEILTRYCDKSTMMFKMIQKEGIKIHSMNVHHLTLKTMSMFKRNLDQFFSEYGKKFDILHIHFVEDPFVARIAKKNGIDTIVTHVHSFRIKSNIIADWVKRLCINKNSRCANVRLACSFDVGNRVYPPKYKSEIKVVSNGINAKDFRFDKIRRMEYRRKLNLNDSFVVCSVGRLEDIKNHEFLIDIFANIEKKHGNSRLLIVGNGSLREWLYEKCIQYGIEEKVYFLGDREDVNCILQAADTFVLTSKSEGFGIVLIEAQAAGLKVFASDKVIPRAVKITGLLKFIDLEETADKWAEYILKGALEYNRVDKYKEIICAGFDNGQTSRNLMTIYERRM